MKKHDGRGKQQVPLDSDFVRIADVVLTREQASKYLKVGLSTLPKLPITVLRLGRSIRYHKSDLDAFIFSVRQGGSNE